MVGETLREGNLLVGLALLGERRSDDEGDGGGRRRGDNGAGSGGRGELVDFRGDGRGDGLGEGLGEGSYIGGGTKDAFFAIGVPPASRAACRSEAYLS